MKLGVHAGLLDRLPRVLDHREVREHRDVVPLAPQRGRPEGYLVVEAVDRDLALGAVEVDVLEHQHRVIDGQRGVHQAHIVEGG